MFPVIDSPVRDNWRPFVDCDSIQRRNDAITEFSFRPLLPLVSRFSPLLAVKGSITWNSLSMQQLHIADVVL